MQTVQTFLRRPQVQAATGLPTSTLYDLMAKGAFPRPVKLSARAVGWNAIDVAKWQEDRIASGREGNGDAA